MREKFELNSGEKILQEVFRGLLILIFSVVFKGMYNQSNHIDQDYILVPTFLILSEIFCVGYTFNAFATGNLVRNWASTPLFNFLFYTIKRKSIKTDDEALRFTTKIFGFFTLLLAVVVFISAIIFYQK